MTTRDSRITVSGSVIEEPATGSYGYGVPLQGVAEAFGRLTVTGGATLALTAPQGVGPLVEIGTGAGVSGEAVIADPDSRLALVAGAAATPGPRLRVGEAGGDGTLLVLSGAEVAVNGADATMTVGRGPISQGFVDLLGGRLMLAGVTAALALGESGGSGRLRLLSGGRLSLDATVGPARLDIGASGGDGDMLVAEGLASVIAGPEAPVTLALGVDGGNGRLDITGPPAFDGPASPAGLVLAGAGAAARIGDAGTGAIALEGGVLALVDSAADPDQLSTLLGVAAAAGDAPVPGGAVGLAIGSAGGSGSLVATGGAAVLAVGDGPVDLDLGAGGSGTLALAGASMLVESLGTGVRLAVGTGGGAGLMQLGSGASASLRAAAAIDARLGAGAILEIDGGTMLMDAGGALQLDIAAGAITTVAAGGRLDALAASTATTIAGTVQIDAAALNLVAAGRVALEVGAGGLLSLGAGATATLTGGAVAAATPGALPDGDGRVALAEGARLVLWGDAVLGAGGGLAAVGGDLRLGSGARLSAGAEVTLSGSASLVLDGADLTAPLLRLDPGTVLAGSGTLAADVGLDGVELRVGDRADGEVAFLPGFGTLDVLGDLTKSGGSLFFDVAEEGADLLAISGRLTLSGTQLSLQLPAPGAPLPGGALLLASAAGGIALEAVDAPGDLALELRAGGTELWALAPPPEPEPPPPAILTGTVRTPAGAMLDGVAITFLPEDGGPDTTAITIDGGFSLAREAAVAGRIEAALPAAAVPTVATALEVLRLSVGLQPGWGAARPEDFIAADITGDGRVTAADALAILRRAVGLPTEHAPRWVFLDSSEIGPQSRSAVAYETGLWIAPDSEMSADLTAILIGLPGAFG